MQRETNPSWRWDKKTSEPSLCLAICVHAGGSLGWTQHYQGLESSYSIRVKLLTQLMWQTNISKNNHILWEQTANNQRGLEDSDRMSPVLFSATCDIVMTVKGSLSPRHIMSYYDIIISCHQEIFWHIIYVHFLGESGINSHRSPGYNPTYL